MTYEVRQFDLSGVQGLSKKAIDLHLGLYKGYVDNLDRSVIGRYKAELLEYIHTSQSALLDNLRKKGALDKEVEEQLQAALKSFGERFDPKKA